MGLVVLCSASGSPGVTTGALGLALTWPGDVLLADCDRDPSQSIQAGFLRGVAVGDRGLAQLARAHRERRPLVEELMVQAVPLQHGEWSRNFLPGFTHPGAANVFGPVWPDLVTAFQQLSRGGTDVVVDAGRIGRDGLPAPLLAAADVVLVVVRSTLRSLAAARLHVPGLVAHHAMVSGRGDLGLAVRGPGAPYSMREIDDQFPIPVAVTWAEHREHAQVLSEGSAPPRRFHEGTLLRSCRAAAASLHQQLDRRSSVVAVGGADDWRDLAAWGAR